MKRIQNFGWRRQSYDPRDHKFLPKIAATALPPFVDLVPTPWMPPIYDQGQLGSCTANACAALIQFNRRMQLLPDFVPSRLQIYYNTRKIEGTIASDAGGEIRDTIKAVAVAGACDENEWPYDITQFAVAPSNQAALDALKDRAVQYASINNADLNAVRSCLAEGYPVEFGVTLFQQFEEVGPDGRVDTPSSGFFRAMLEPPIGDHAMCIVGYDDASHRFKVRNSWGTGWGMGGYCWMGYDYLSNQNMASDFWDVRLVSQ